MSKQRAHEAFEAELRICAVVDLASQLATEAYYHTSTFEPLGEFIEHLFDAQEKHASLMPLVRQVRAFRDEDDDSEVTIEQAGASLADCVFGFALRLATPRRDHRSENAWRSGSSSYTCWVYAETLEQAWALGLQWAAERHQADLECFTSKKGCAV